MMSLLRDWCPTLAVFSLENRRTTTDATYPSRRDSLMSLLKALRKPAGGGGYSNTQVKYEVTLLFLNFTQMLIFVRAPLPFCTGLVLHLGCDFYAAAVSVCLRLQVQLLQAELKPSFPALEINTIDKYQGRDKKVMPFTIIGMCVR